MHVFYTTAYVCFLYKLIARYANVCNVNACDSENYVNIFIFQ